MTGAWIVSVGKYRYVYIAVALLNSGLKSTKLDWMMKIRCSRVYGKKCVANPLVLVPTQVRPRKETTVMHVETRPLVRKQ